MDEHDKKTEEEVREEIEETAEKQETAEDEIPQRTAETAGEAVSGAERADTTRPEEALENVNEAVKNLGGSLAGLEVALHQVARSLESLREARRTFSRVGWAVFLLLPVSTLLQFAAAVILSTVRPGWQNTWLFWAVAVVPLYVAAMPLALWMMRSLPAYPPEKRSLGFWRFAGLFPVSIMLTYAGSAASLLILYLFSRSLGTALDNPVSDMIQTDISPLLRNLLMVCAAPVMEEIVFRKAILDRTRVYGEKLALCVSAALFAMVHGNLSQFLYALLMGLVLGYVYLRTGRLRYTIALHVFVNFMGIVVPSLVARYGSLPGLDGSMDGSVVTVVYALALLLLCGGGLAILAENWRRIRFEPAEQQLPRGSWFRVAVLRPGMIFMALSFVVMSVLALLE